MAWSGERRNRDDCVRVQYACRATHGNNRKFWFMNYFGQRTMQIKCTNLHFTVVSHIDSYLPKMKEKKNENAQTARVFSVFFFGLIYCVVPFIRTSTWNCQYLAPNLSDHNILCWLSVRTYSSHRRPPRLKLRRENKEKTRTNIRQPNIYEL